MKTPISHTQKIFLSIFCVMFFSSGVVFAIDSISEYFTDQTATQPWSNESLISMLVWWSIDDPAYINAGNNSTIIWNYFSWYYYDSVYGFFRLNWSNNLWDNVRIVSWTNACTDDYGYKIGWYAYSDSAGLIDFDYNDNIYVYYCLSDKKMHGYAYSETLGFQSFEWIWFEIITSPGSEDIGPSGSDLFVNDQTQITDVSSPENSNNNNDNAAPNIIWSDRFEFLDTDESIFYIIK